MWRKHQSIYQYNVVTTWIIRMSTDLTMQALTYIVGIKSSEIFILQIPTRICKNLHMFRPPHNPYGIYRFRLEIYRLVH